MKVFRKRIWRGIKAHMGRYIALFLLMVLMISATSGFYVVSDSTKFKNQELMSKGRVEDGQVTTSFPLSGSIIDKIKDKNVEIENMYYVNIDIKKKKTLRVFANREKINKPVLNKGRLANKRNEIALNRIYAENNKIKIGDKISISGKYFKDGKAHKMKVTGIFALPDFNSSFAKNSDLMYDGVNFGETLVSEKFFSKFIASEVHYQTSYRFNDRNLSEKQTERLNTEIFKTANKDKTVIGFMPKKINNAIMFMMNDMGGDRPMMTIFMGIMITLIAFIFAVMASGLIREESENIGTLMANGYRKRELIKFYISTPIIITLVAAVVGNVLGYTVYIRPFADMYYKSFELPNFEAVFNARAFFISTILPFVIMLIINFINLERKLKFTPLAFIRGETYNRKISKVKMLKSKSFESRFRKRVFLRNKGDYTVMVIGILITTLLMMYGFIIEPTFNKYEKETSRGIPSKYQYILKAPVAVVGDSNSAEKYSASMGSVYIKIKKAEEDINIYGIDKNSKYFKKLSLPKKSDEIVISENLGKKLRIDVGDKLKVTDKLEDKTKTYKIVGTYDYPTTLSVFMSRSNLNKTLNRPADYYNGYFSNKKLNIDENFIATVIDEKMVASIGKQVKDMVEEMINIIMFVAMLFFFIVMFILTKILMDKNSLSIAYLKVFGYSNREINRIYLRSTTMTLILTLLISIPLQIKMLKILGYLAFMKFSGYFELEIPAKAVIMTIGLAILIYAVVSIIQMKRISRMSFSEALKNRE